MRRRLIIFAVMVLLYAAHPQLLLSPGLRLYTLPRLVDRLIMWLLQHVPEE